jgi:hypothetical protein
MDRLERERLWLQRVVGVAGLVPVLAGLYGVVFGAALTGDNGLSVSGDSHYRYLSGLLLGIGLMFWSGIPGIEARKGRFQLLTLVVVVGGLSRLAGLLFTGLPSLPMLIALVMELVVTPLICLWQMRIASRFPGSASLSPTPAPAATAVPL